MEIRTSTGQVMQEQEFRAYTQANGGPTWDVTTPEVLASLGADIVLEGPQATTSNAYEYSYRNGVEQIDGQWYTKYSVGPVFTDRPATDTEPAKTADEQMAEYKAMKDAEQAKNVRQSRNTKLADSDWVVIKALETGTAVPAGVAAERQALRDITTQAGFPWTVTWPDAE